MADEIRVSSGVQELIARLKGDGVAAGRNEAQRLVSEAQEKAAQIINQARVEADKLMSDSRMTIDAERNSAVEALRVALRDAELMFESELRGGFAEHVKRLVSMEMEDREFLKQLILAVVGRLRPKIPEGEGMEIMVPPDQLKHLVLGISGDMLREGVEIKRGIDGQVGLRIKLKGEDVEIELTDRAISDVLLKYLLPRYRAIVAGVE